MRKIENRRSVFVDYLAENVYNIPIGTGGSIVKKKMKKGLLLLLSVVIGALAVGCRDTEERSQSMDRSQTEKATVDESAVTIPLSPETAEMIKRMQAQGANHALSEEAFPALLQDLRSRGGQELPQVDTKTPQGHTVIAENEVYTLDRDDADCVILYLHGGAYAFGIGEQQILFCDKMAQRLNAKVYLPLYPLTPQATVHDAIRFLDAVYDELLKEGKPVLLLGDSAGGGLALALAQRLRDRGAVLPKKLILLSPWVDVTMSDPAIPAYDKKDLRLDAYGLVELGKLWAADLDTKDPLVSPIYGDLSGLPPTIVFTGTAEIMVPDNTTLCRRMKEAGVDCSLIYGEELWHVFVIDDIPEGEIAADRIVEFCR